MRLVIALGGNAIKQAHEAGTSEEQFRNCDVTARHIARIIEGMAPDDTLTITHGNGPQAGNLLVQQDAAQERVPAHPLDVVGSMTQGQIGYMLQQTITNRLTDLGVERSVLAVVNRVMVNRDDPEFFGETASKPVGNFFTEKRAKQLRAEHPDYIYKNVKPGVEDGWRRVVPSPDPIKNVEAGAIRTMVDAGIIVIASGGGGIPVALDEHGHYRGVEAVIDKDLAGQRLAAEVDANVYLILTDVEHAKLNFGKPDERIVERMTVNEARGYLDKGHFLAGSMGPKVKACLRFLDNGGERAVITSLDKALEGLRGEAGTQILPD
jgi:carbamate kinase